MTGTGRHRAVPSPAVTSEEKRQRHKEGHRSRVEAARVAQRAADRRQRLVVLGVRAPDVPRVSGAAAGTFLTYAWSR